MLVTILFSNRVLATSECTGRTQNREWVTVVVNTSGATGRPDRGEVIIEKDNNKYGYRFNQQDIAQFFEYDETANNTALVGLAAYVNNEYPVMIKYHGRNYIDMDHKTVIEESKSEIKADNFIRIWKGPGYPANDQFQLNKVVCSTWLNI